MASAFSPAAPSFSSESSQIFRSSCLSQSQRCYPDLQRLSSNLQIVSPNSQRGFLNSKRGCPDGSLFSASSAIADRRRSSAFSAYGNGGVGSEDNISIAECESRIAELKQALVDSIDTTHRGLQANGETRSEIMELITQVEARNPNPNPTQALELLGGKWILRYTSLSEFFPLLAAGSLPLIKVGEISQTINSNEYLILNSVSFIGPLGTTCLSANASFEICSPKRLQIKFEEGVIGAPQITNSFNLPESLDFLGQKVDLTAFQGLFQTLQSATYSIARTISGQAPFKFPIRNESVQSWLVTTYLDQDLRISRGDNGTVFVFLKDASLLMEQSQ